MTNDDKTIALSGRAGITVKDTWGRTLLETTDAAVIDFRDPTTGRLIAVMVRLVDNRMWGLVTEKDPDWQDVLGQLGYQPYAFKVNK